MKNINNKNNDNKGDAFEKMSKHFFTLLAESEFKNKGDKTYIFTPTAVGKTANIIQKFGRSVRRDRDFNKRQYILTPYVPLKEGIDMRLVDESHNTSVGYAKFLSEEDAITEHFSFKIVPTKRDKASYEEHLKVMKQFNNARAYDLAKKNTKFYSSVSFIKKMWPNKDIYKNAGWANMFDTKASYEEHINECKKHKNAIEYSRANKDTRFFKNADTLKRKFPNIAKDAGWAK